MPAVQLQMRAAPSALQSEAGLGGHPARDFVVDRVRKFKAVKAGLVERPGRQRGEGSGGNTGAAGIWQDPVRALSETLPLPRAAAAKHRHATESRAERKLRGSQPGWLV